MISVSIPPVFNPMSNYLLLGAIATLAYILYRRLRETSQEDSSEIVFANHIVPWIGSPFRCITKGPRAFMLECSQKLGPIFGFSVFGQRVIMISSLNSLREVFKLERNGAFTVREGQLMHLMTGYRGSAERREWIYNTLQQQAFRHFYHAFSAQELHRHAPHINSIIRDQINATLHSSGGSNLSMIYITRRIVLQSVITFFYGREMPDIFEDTNLLDIKMVTIMYGLEALVPSASRAQERVYRTYAKHVSEKWVGCQEGHLEGASDFMSEIIRTMKAMEFTPEELARYLIAIMWGTTSSLMNVSTWTMGMIISDSNLSKAVAKEVQLATTNLTPDELLEFKPNTQSFPFLDSLIQEVLRTKTQLPLVRVAQQDLIIMDEGREIHIHKGDFIIPNTPSLNRTSAYFGDELQNFKPERFVDSPERKALYVFGAGQHICAGQRLALHLIRMIVVLMFHSFDIKLNPTSDKVLRETKVFSSFTRIANDLVIDVAPRIVQ